jgi:hypothetical protein
MSVVNWISEKVVSRIVTIISGLIITKVESDALNSHFDLLESIEARAHQFELDGKTELAARLREQAANLVIDKPGQTSTQITNHLIESGKTMELPKLGDAPRYGSESSGKTKPAATKRGRGRPPKHANQEDAS